MKKTYWILILGILVLLVNVVISIAVVNSRSSPNGLALSDSMDKHISTLGHFAILHSKKWFVFDLPQGNHGDMETILIIDTPPNFFESGVEIHVAQKKFMIGEMEEVAEWAISRDEDMMDYKQIGGKKYNHEKNEGSINEFFTTLGNPWNRTKYRCIDWYTLQPGMGYRFLFCADNEKWKEIEDTIYTIIDNIEFMDQK